MAFLLLLHQKMRLQRKENALTLKQLQFSSKVDRMQKKVDKRQKYYDKLKKQIERQANAYKNQANLFFNNQMGLGTNGVNLNNMYGSSMAAIQALSQWGDKDPMGNPVNADDIKIAQAYMAGQFKPETDNDGKTTYTYEGKTYNKDELYKYEKIANMANSQVSQMQAYAGQCKTNYENNISIWQQAAEDELEAREEWEMDLLSEEQADMEAEKNSIEVQLQRVQEEKKNVEQALGNAIQDSAPKFGLG